MIKNISDQWKLSMQKNPQDDIRVYIDARRVEYGPIAGSAVYHENLALVDPVQGQYSLGVSSLVHALPFSLPCTFEIKIKPQWAYNVAADVEFLSFFSDTYDNARLALCYFAETDQIGLKAYTSSAGSSVVQSDTKLAKAYTSSLDLQQWMRLTVVINTTTIKIYSGGRALVSTSVDITGHKNKVFLAIGNGAACFINYFMFFPAFEATQAQILSKYHRVLNECVYFGMQGVCVGRTRCDVSKFVASFSHEYKDGYNAATFNATVNNLAGQFSADQYAAFEPSSQSYNGLSTEAYLAKREVGISQEYRSKQKDGEDATLAGYWSMDGTPEIPDNAAGTSYLQDAWATTDGFTGSGALSVSSGTLIQDCTAGQYNNKVISSSLGLFRIKVKQHSGTLGTLRIDIAGGTQTNPVDLALSRDYKIFDIPFTGTMSSMNLLIAEYASQAYGLTVDFIYVGSGLYDTRLVDNSGNGNAGTINGATPVPGISGKVLSFNGVNNYVTNPFVWPAVWTYNIWIKVGLYDATPRFVMASADSWLLNGFGIYITTGNVSFALSDPAGHIVSGGYATSRTDWFMMTLQYNGYGNALNVYVDGILNYTISLATLTANPNPTQIKYGQYGIYGYFSGIIDEPRIYSRALTAAEVLAEYNHFNSDLYALTTDADFEPGFYGTIEKGAFARSTQQGALTQINVSADDFIKNIALRKVTKARYWEDYYIARAAPASNSLIHEYAQLASRKECYNYACNSGFENATIANSWSTASTFSRSATVKARGSYSGKLVGAANAYFEQWLTVGLSKGEKFTFQIYVYATAAVYITLYLKDYLGATNKGESNTAILHTGKGWQLCSITHTVVDSTSDRLLVQIQKSDAQDLYFDMAMLTYGELKTFYAENTNDGVSGVGSYLQAIMGYYEQIGIDAEDVAYQNPWAIINKGDSPWDMLKQLSDASICRFLHVNQAGVLRYRSCASSDIEAVARGIIPKANAVSTSAQPLQANKIVVEGVMIHKQTVESCVFQAKNSALKQDSFWDDAYTLPKEDSFQRNILHGTTYPDATLYPLGVECAYGMSDGVTPTSTLLAMNKVS